MRFETDAIHAGQDPDPTTGSIVVPIHATSTYAQDAPGEHKGYEYSRTDNPTRHALETALSSLEGIGAGSRAVATSSGMAAAALIGYLLKPGDHLLLPDDAYGGTFRFFARVLSDQGIMWSAVDMTDSQHVEAALRPETRLFWVESPTNPLLRLVDLKQISELAHQNGSLMVVDNTLATPYLQRPFEFGADLVVHSTTKYLGGHSDIVGGAVLTRDPELLDRLRFLQNTAGPIPGPFDAWLVLRGIKTLAIRMERHCDNAQTLAVFLEGHDNVAQVLYPGLDSHPQHSLARRQMKRAGGMVSFRPVGGPDAAHRIASTTRVFTLAESLGGVESLIEIPSEMTHASVAGTLLEVPDDLIRLSVGIEHVDDLLEDLERALRS
ncbi:cystathionine gamma-synthase [bacterium BMS3Abin02]|nr:cystathionine gamma-synthase [bacterium BMS3Abin02]HDL49422.1 cystathionine gamma-synthase [Actinomycetota bacterium]